MSTAVKRACDACHRRKVKCDGINPCRNCSSAQLACTYNAIPQKKGPKGSRAKVISELRETQRQTSLSAKVQSRLNGLGSPPCNSPSIGPTPGLLAPEMIKEAVEFFFANMYSIMPILHRPRLEQECMFMDQSPTAYCLLASLSAFMLFQPGMSLPSGDPLLEHMPGAHIASGTLLMEEAVRVRGGFDYLDSPGLDSICTSYFLFCSHYALENHERAWFYLREATTLAYMCGMTREESYLQHDNIESSRRRRLYWLLFVTERAYALQRGRPLTLQASINLPTISDDPSDPLAHQLSAYLLLVNLFRLFDDVFINFWNKSRGECSASYLGGLRKEFSERTAGLMNEQEVDQRLIQQWLKSAIWQMSMQNGCIPQNGQDQLHYQIDMSRELMSMASQFQTQSTELLGVPLVAKLLDIACSLIDVLAIQPPHADPFTMGPRGHLKSLLQILSSLRNGHHHFLPLLLDKVHDVLPRLANPMLQRAPDNAPIPNLANIDIFDGFGNGGMAQPPILTDFKMEPYTSNGIPHLQDIPAVDSSSSSGGSDMKSPFSMAGSPPVMSPNGDYSRGGEFNSMPEILMSPMGQPQPPSLGQPGNHQHQHQIHNMVSQSINQNHHVNNSMSIEMHNNLPNGLSQATNYVNMGQPQSLSQNPPYSQTNQGMMSSNVMHRVAPRRTNSFALHQHQHQHQQHQHQPSPHIPRTVGDFHALQRANSENVAMNSIGMRQAQPELDFSGLP